MQIGGEKKEEIGSLQGEREKKGGKQPFLSFPPPESPIRQLLAFLLQTDAAATLPQFLFQSDFLIIERVVPEIKGGFRNP